MQFQNILEALKKNLAADLQLTIAPDKLQSLQAEYLQNMQALWTQGLQASTGNSDRRFAHEAWRKNPLSAFQVASYQLQAKTMTALAEQLQGDEKTVARLRFAVQQWLAAAAPSNFLATNPEVQEKAIATQGESLRKGLNNLLADVRKGHMSMTDESQFEVGKNLATTPGQVIFENEFFQLIEYAPQTAQVHAVPLVMVPACINKFYILDLQEKNSLARYAVEQGIRTFMVSWRNPDASIAHATWDNYVQDVIIKAIEVAAEISPTKTVNALGFCIGGTLLANALAVLAARGDQPVASATFLTTLLDFENTGVDVNAQPVGKTVKKMSLLSGGEKSMTAMALLFAVYRIRQTPFYILDEIEAALDDSNLRRLMNYLATVRDFAQFIMITHQRRTMEAADILYGVSMQADGVTKVLSQRIDQARAKEE